MAFCCKKRYFCAMMYLKKINKEDIESARRLYVSAFPPEERRDWEDVISRAGAPGDGFVMYGIYTECGFEGFMTVWRFKAMRYVEHFAVAESARGKGIGGMAISKLRDEEDVPVILEVELPICGAEAQRRIGFYERHGFTAHRDFRYVQPPYGENLPSVELMLMTSGPVDLREATRTLHRDVYGVTDEAPAI